MESLGMQMRESAGILKAIADGAEGRGYSIERIRDNVGDLHEDLDRAGQRYEPSGKVLREYGEALVEVQTLLNTVADNCVELWATYETARGTYTDAADAPAPADETPEQATERAGDVADLRTSRDDAYDAWLEEATRYDVPFDTWDDAYENALNGLEDANERGVSDSFWDNALPLIEGILVVLAVAGVVLAVLAIVIGGPIIALLGVIAGIATLGLTIWKVAAGRGNGWDIAIAAIGVIPFGRLAKLGSVFKGQTGVGAFLTGFGSDLVGLTAFREMRALNGFTNFFRSAPVVNSAGNLTQSSGIISQVRAFGDDLAGLSYTGPSGWVSRILGGTGGATADGISGAYAQYGVAVTNRVDGYLAGTVLDGMQHGSTLTDQAFNIIDSVVKPGWGAYELGNQGVEAITDPTDRWASELARTP